MNRFAKALAVATIAVSVLAGQTPLEDGRELHAVGVSSGFPTRQYQGDRRVQGDGVRVQQGSSENELSAPGYEARIVVDRPGKKVVLLLGSYNGVRWNIEVKPQTELERVVLIGAEPPPVINAQPDCWLCALVRRETTPTSVFLNGKPFEGFERNATVPFANADRGESFRTLVEKAPGLYGFDQLDSFQGAAVAPLSGFRVDVRQSDNPNLKPDYLLRSLTPANELPDVPFVATLGDVTALYDLRGKLLELRDLSDLRWVIVPELGASFAFNEMGFLKRIGDETIEISPPATVPEISYPFATAYDSKRKLLLGVTGVDGGYLYTYSLSDGRWMAYRLNGIGVVSLAYDAKRDLYIGTTYVTGRGDPLRKFDPDKGFGSINPYDATFTQHFPGLDDLPRSTTEMKIRAVTGDHMVLVAGDGLGRKYRVYLYDLRSDKISLVRYSR